MVEILARDIGQSANLRQKRLFEDARGFRCRHTVSTSSFRPGVSHGCRLCSLYSEVFLSIMMFFIVMVSGGCASDLFDPIVTIRSRL